METQVDGLSPEAFGFFVRAACFIVMWMTQRYIEGRRLKVWEVVFVFLVGMTAGDSIAWFVANPPLQLFSEVELYTAIIYLVSIAVLFGSIVYAVVVFARRRKGKDNE